MQRVWLKAAPKLVGGVAIALSLAVIGVFLLSSGYIIVGPWHQMDYEHFSWRMQKGLACRSVEIDFHAEERYGGPGFQFGRPSNSPLVEAICELNVINDVPIATFSRLARDQARQSKDVVVAAYISEFGCPSFFVRYYKVEIKDRMPERFTQEYLDYWTSGSQCTRFSDGFQVLIGPLLWSACLWSSLVAIVLCCCKVGSRQYRLFRGCCANCGYSRVGIIASQCPECGDAK